MERLRVLRRSIRCSVVNSYVNSNLTPSKDVIKERDSRLDSEVVNDDLDTFRAINWEWLPIRTLECCKVDIPLGLFFVAARRIVFEYLQKNLLSVIAATESIRVDQNLSKRMFSSFLRLSLSFVNWKVLSW